MNRIWSLSVALFALALSLTIQAGWSGSTVDSASAGLELARNRDFNLLKTGWHFNGTGSGVGATGQDGGQALTLEGILETTAGAYQLISWPDQVSGITIALDYRLQPTVGGTAQLVVGILTDSQPVASWIAVSPTSGDSGWQPYSVVLDGQTVSAIAQAHQKGNRTYLAIELQQAGSNMFKLLLDNVSVQAEGQWTIPSLSGAIAYIGMDASGNGKTVHRISPNGGSDQLLFTNPGDILPQVLDVAWKPDGSQLAFSSNHESVYSAFQADIYGMNPNGGSLHRITNPPARADLPGTYPTGEVTGRIYNAYGNAVPFLIYVEGALEPVSLSLAGFEQETPFTVKNVADLGPGVLHYVVFSWGSTQCANGREYAAALLDVVANDRVDVGSLTFHGYCNHYEADNLSWKRDGSALGFTAGSQPRRVAATGEAIGTELFSGSTFADNLAWSPVDDRVVYYNGLGVGSTSGYYLTQPGGGVGSQLFSASGILADGADWLPNGQGFVYSAEQNLLFHSFGSGTQAPLTNFFNSQGVNFHEYAINPNLSPDGGYVVFERISYEVSPPRRELWILDRQAPQRMWPVQTDGRSGNPDWSLVDPQTASYAIYLPVIIRP